MAAEIVSTIVQAFTSLVTGIAGGVVDAFNAIAVNSEGGLTDFAIWALVFAGVGMATAIIAAVTRKVG